MGDFQLFNNGAEIFKGGIDGVAFVVAFSVFSSGLDGGLHHLVVSSGGFGVDDLAQTVEHESDRTAFTHVSAILRECGPHICGCSIAVVGKNFDDQTDPARPKALITTVLVIVGFSA